MVVGGEGGIDGMKSVGTQDIVDCLCQDMLFGLGQKRLTYDDRHVENKVRNIRRLRRPEWINELSQLVEVLARFTIEETRR